VSDIATLVADLERPAPLRCGVFWDLADQVGVMDKAPDMGCHKARYRRAAHEQSGDPELPRTRACTSVMRSASRTARGRSKYLATCPTERSAAPMQLDDLSLARQDPTPA
jgi:hypothetical protein